MNNSSGPRIKPAQLATLFIHLIGHTFATLLTTLLVICAVVPPQQAFYIFMLNVKVPELRTLGWSDGLLLLLMGGLIWGLLFGTYRLFMRRHAQRPLRHVRLSRGTIMTETAIILPVYFMLTFGLGQMSLNFIAGSLANVAGYMASRSYWVWEGEVNKNRAGTNVTDAMAMDRAKIAGALVMAAVAPGDMGGASFGGLTTSAEKARAMTGPGGVDSGEIAAALSLVSGNFGLGETSYVRSFDVSSVLIRGALKFTHAYKASTVTKENGGIKYTYKMLQSMPVVGRFFGQRDGLYYYLTINRDYKFTQQLYKANATNPNSSYSGGTSNDGSVSIGDALGGTGGRYE